MGLIWSWKRAAAGAGWWLLLLVGVWGGGPLVVVGQSVVAIARGQAPAVVVLEALDEEGRVRGQGSGFLVTSTGTLVTNLHVLRGAARLQVRLSTGDLYQTTELVDVDEVRDLALVRIRGYGLPTVALGDSETVEVGESVVVISSPAGLTNSLSTGILSGVRRLETHRIFQMTAPIGQGSSGGPLFDSRGEVIGVVTSLLQGGQNLNFAIPINYVRGMIRDEPTIPLSRFREVESPRERRRGPLPFASGAVQAEEEGESVDAAPLLPVSRGKRGGSPLDPMFPRPDEALALFYRFVDGIGRTTFGEVRELTRTAALVLTGNDTTIESYTIRHLSYHHGMTLHFTLPDRLLTTVDLLVTWTEEDLRNTFGPKFKRRTLGEQRILDYGRLETGRSLVAYLDRVGNIRTLRFTRVTR
jgi:S1-C subfamily serine protease